MTDAEWKEFKEEIKHYEYFDEYDVEILKQSEELLASYRTGPEGMLVFKDDAEFVDVMKKLVAISGQTCTPIIKNGEVTTLFHVGGNEDA